VTGDDVLQAAASVEALLRPALERDWQAKVPGLEWTVARTVAHAGGAALWYAFDLWSGPSDDAAFDLTVKHDAPNQAILLSLVTAATVCAASIDAAPPDRRGFHPSGSPDPSGFAAMACDELLVHGADAARGLGLEFSPDKRLAEGVLRRLFPWHEVGPDPWETLLWANDRLVLVDRPGQIGWDWHPAPLSEWDGNSPGKS
jgi:uncharacterized protein (TIGR03083 family)